MRFGNVLNSSGSVIPIFRRQIERGGPVTVTHPEMTRYFMTIPEAVSLIVQAGAIGGRGQVFVLDMGEPVAIIDLAEKMIRLSGREPKTDIEIQIVGLRPGEKLHEELWGEGETVKPTTHAKISRATRPAIDSGLARRRAGRARAARRGRRHARGGLAASPRCARAAPVGSLRFWKIRCTDGTLAGRSARYGGRMILEGLNAEQRRAVEAVRGPVCILAGAGSGKTTTITRRIANQVATGAFGPSEILAVTFTDKAAGEMRSRLAALGAGGVRARTFHSAALAQLRHFAPGEVGRIVPSKALAPAPDRQRAAPRRTGSGPRATSPPRSSGRRTAASRRATYRAALGDREPPIPPDLMLRSTASYEERKAAAGAIDFEDLLERTVRLFETDASARRRSARATARSPSTSTRT